MPGRHAACVAPEGGKMGNGKGGTKRKGPTGDKGKAASNDQPDVELLNGVASI